MLSRGRYRHATGQRKIHGSGRAEFDSGLVQTKSRLRNQDDHELLKGVAELSWIVIKEMNYLVDGWIGR